LESKDESKIRLLGIIDTLIDGPYVEELKDLGLPYRGSKNQRMINVKSSLKQQEIMLANI